MKEFTARKSRSSFRLPWENKQSGRWASPHNTKSVQCCQTPYRDLHGSTCPTWYTCKVYTLNCLGIPQKIRLAWKLFLSRRSVFNTRKFRANPSWFQFLRIICFPRNRLDNILRFLDFRMNCFNPKNIGMSCKYYFDRVLHGTPFCTVHNEANQ